jgi:subtilisin-like proprotein convertase family protein
LVDASAALELATSWSNLPSSFELEYEGAVDKIIPDDGVQGLEESIYIQSDMTVEFIDIYFDAPDHKKVGDLEITLISPTGTESRLSEVHNQLFGLFRYKNWRFGSLRHLGEPARGSWTLRVQDKRPGNQGTWIGWKMKIQGHQVNTGAVSPPCNRLLVPGQSAVNLCQDLTRLL